MPITVTQSASNKIQELVLKNHKTVIRFGIRGGGCSGFTYLFEFLGEDEEIDEKWKTFQFDGFSIVVDPKSYFFLNGTEVDWTEELMGNRFVFGNPNVDTACGCGESISFKVNEEDDDG